MHNDDSLRRSIITPAVRGDRQRGCGSTDCAVILATRHRRAQLWRRLRKQETIAILDIVGAAFSFEVLKLSRVVSSQRRVSSCPDWDSTFVVGDPT